MARIAVNSSNSNLSLLYSMRLESNIKELLLTIKLRLEKVRMRMNKLIMLRVNRATADLTEHLANTKFTIELEQVLPTVYVDCVLITGTTTGIHLRVTLQEAERIPENPGSLFYGFKVEEITEHGLIFEVGSGRFDTAPLNSFRSVLAAGHLAGDLIKFHYKGE